MKRKCFFPYRISSIFFQDSFVFGETSSSHFFRVATSTQQLLFRGSYFFRAANFFAQLLFQNSRFFAAVIFFRIATFSERNFCRTASSCEQLVLQGSYFVGTAASLMKELVQNKDIYRTAFLKQVLLQNRYFFNKGTFFKRCTSSHRDISFWRATFSEWVKPNFSQQVLFRRATFQNILFQKRYYFTFLFPFFSLLPIYQLVIK